MAELFSQKYQLLWALVLAAMLFYPVRQLIWALSVRRAERDGQPDETRRNRLRRRATITSIMLVFVFAFLYTAAIMKGGK
jgi:hypothetical protein